MATRKSIPVVTRLQDNGDGGYTTYVYNNIEEMLADHPKSSGYKNGKTIRIKLSQEQKDEILDGDDEYENGYIGTSTVDILIDDDGTVTLAEPLSFHGGQ